MTLWGMTPVAVCQLSVVSPIRAAKLIYLFVYTCKLPLAYLCFCFHLLDSAVSISDCTFAWDRDAEPLLKEYVCFVQHFAHLMIQSYGYKTWLLMSFCDFHNIDIYMCSVYVSSVSLDVKPGRLVAIVGAVGSGKSSLIAALLGEMHKVKGFVKIQVKSYFWHFIVK